MPAIVFDANGTLFDLAPVADAIGGPERLEAFFQRTLHTAAAITLTGAWSPFDEIAAAALETTCAKLGLDDVDRPSVLAALKELPPYPDAAEAAAAAPRAAILTNSAADSARELVERVGLDVDKILSCEEVRAYKPAPPPYLLAQERLGDYVLVAAHAWDVVGARACGIRAIWVRRDEREWPFPELEAGESAETLRDAVALAA